MFFRLGALVLLFSAPVSAQVWTDNFNRYDGSAMGPNWAEVAGDLAISNSEAHGNLAIGFSKMIHATASQDWRISHAEATLLPPTGYSGPHVALILGAGGTRNLYTKIQDNDGNGDYDRIFFYNNDNTGAWGSRTYVSLANPFVTARVAVYVGADMDSIVVDIDTDFDGAPDETHSNIGIAPFAAQLGNGYGIGTWAFGRFDNWQAGGATMVGFPDIVSLSTGGSVVLNVSLGAPQALKPYQVLGSVTGDAPGILFGSTVIPLNLDPYLIFTLLNPNTPLLNGSAGLLNSLGAATAVFTLPSASDPGLSGISVHHAAIVIETIGGSITVTGVTGSFAFTLIP